MIACAIVFLINVLITVAAFIQQPAEDRAFEGDKINYSS